MSDELFTYMAQRDDARAAGDDAEFNYWRGYIDAAADHLGLTDQLDEIEAAYQLMQIESAHQMDEAAAAAQRRRPH